MNKSLKLLVKKLQEEFQLDAEFANFLGKIIVEEKENYKEYEKWFKFMELLFKTPTKNDIVEKVKHFAPNPKALHSMRSEKRANVSFQIIKSIKGIVKEHTTNNEDKLLVERTIYDIITQDLQSRHVSHYLVKKIAEMINEKQSTNTNAVNQYKATTGNNNNQTTQDQSDNVPRLNIAMKRQHKSSLNSCLDIINSLHPYSTDTITIKALIIPNMKRLVFSNCHTKLRNTQTWESRVMRYINYATTLVMMLFPHDYPFDDTTTKWIEDNKQTDGKLTKIPPWEYVCRFFADMNLKNAESTVLEKKKKVDQTDGKSEKNNTKNAEDTDSEEEFEKTNSSQDMESEHSESEHSESDEVHNSKNQNLETSDKTAQIVDQSNRYQKPNSESTDNQPTVKQYFAERYVLMNKAVLDELYKYYAALIAKKDRKTWKLYVPDTDKPQRKLITDLYHYLWKYQVRLKTGIWHHKHTDINNQPVPKEKKELYNLVKLGVHEEEHDFLENFLNADIIRQSNSLSNFARETKIKDSNKVKKEDSSKAKTESK